MLDKEKLPKVVQTLINSWAILVMAKKRDLNEVPELFVIGANKYELRSYVELEIAERTINALT